jgi:prevent-host-death family protein
MKAASVAELKARLSAYIELAEDGAVIEVRKRNIPVARLVGVPRTRGNRTRLGCMKGTVRIRGDLTQPLIPLDSWDMHKGSP